MSEFSDKEGIHDGLRRILTNVFLRFVDQFFHLQSLLLLRATQLGELLEHVSLTIIRMPIPQRSFPLSLRTGPFRPSARSASKASTANHGWPFSLCQDTKFSAYISVRNCWLSTRVPKFWNIRFSSVIFLSKF